RSLTDFMGSLDNLALTAVRQPDGKLLVLGWAANGTLGTGTADLAVARYNSDGSLDAGFGTEGRARTDFGLPFAGGLPAAIHLPVDGRIVVAAAGGANGPAPPSQLALARYTPAGTLDSSFGTGGKILRDTGLSLTSVKAVTIQSDAKIVLAAQQDVNATGPIVARFNADGTPDIGFGAGGRVSTPLTAGSFLGAMRLAQQADGKILLVGTKFFGPQGHVLIRSNPEGSLDAGFGMAGIALGDLGTGLNATELGLTLQPDGKIVVVGSISDNFAVVRYTVAGALDPSFGTNGRVTTEFSGMD